MTLLPALVFTLLIAAPQGDDPAADYKRLIDEYVRSGSARVPEVLAGWPYDALNTAVTEMVTPHRGAVYYPVADLETLVRWLEAATLAHLEAGRLGVRSKRPGVAVRQIVVGWMLVDRLRSVLGKNRTQRSNPPGGEVRALDDGDAFAARWFAAAGALLQGTTDLAAAYRHFTLGVKAYPRDPRLRLGLGTVSELNTANVMVTILAASGSVLDARQEARNYRHTLLGDAEDQLRTALDLDPTLHEARLRLGRVLQLLNRPKDATALLEQVRAAKATPSLTYLACTLLARAEHEDGRAANAERLYREALAAWPDGQRAAVGLSHVRWLQGLPTTTEFLRRGNAQRRSDPWVDYNLGQYHTVDQAIAELRKWVLR